MESKKERVERLYNKLKEMRVKFWTDKTLSEYDKKKLFEQMGYHKDALIREKMENRKTITIDMLKEDLNRFLEHSTCDAEARQAVASFVSHIFHKTGNYQGFNYLTEERSQNHESDIYGGQYGKDGRVYFY
jgi:hypothetical protein